jgi:hypothetical protein
MLQLADRQIARSARDLCDRGATNGACPPAVELGCSAPTAVNFQPCDDGDGSTFESVCIDGRCVGIVDSDGDGLPDGQDCFIGDRVRTLSLLGALVRVDGLPDFDGIGLDGLSHVVSVTHTTGDVVTFAWACVEPLELASITVERFASGDQGFQAIAGLALQNSAVKDLLYPVAAGGAPAAVCVADIPIDTFGVEQHRQKRTADCSGPDEQLVPCVTDCDGPCPERACLIEGNRIRVTGLQHTSMCTCPTIVASPNGISYECPCPAPIDLCTSIDADGDGVNSCLDCRDDTTYDPAYCQGITPDDCPKDPPFSDQDYSLQRCAVCIYPGAVELCEGWSLGVPHTARPRPHGSDHDLGYRRVLGDGPQRTAIRRQTRDHQARAGGAGQRIRVLSGPGDRGAHGRRGRPRPGSWPSGVRQDADP